MSGFITLSIWENKKKKWVTVPPENNPPGIVLFIIFTDESIFVLNFLININYFCAFDFTYGISMCSYMYSEMVSGWYSRGNHVMKGWM